MANCDQILQLFSPYSKLHMIIVIETASEKINSWMLCKNSSECSSDAKLNSVASLLCLSLSSPNISVTEELAKS